MNLWKKKPNSQLTRDSTDCEGLFTSDKSKTKLLALPLDLVSSSQGGKDCQLESTQGRAKKRIFKNKNSSGDLDDLPDGFCFSRSLWLGEPSQQQSLDFAGNQVKESAVRKCDYVGSFPVAGGDQATRTEFIKSQLEHLRGTKKRKPVLLVVCLSGVKACSLDGKSVLMAHALRRISYASCDPPHCQFSFLAREPKGHFSFQYCHSFITCDPEKAEELSSLVGTAFRMAYAQQLQQQSATFHQLVSRRIQPGSSAGFRQSTESLGDAASTPPSSGPTRPWAKRMAGKTKHHDPVLELANPPKSNRDQVRLQPDTVNGNVRFQPSPDGSCWSVTLSTKEPSSTAGNNATSCNLRPHLNLRLNNGKSPCREPWSPNSTSSSENNSPTDLNSCRRLAEKPALVKTVDLGEDWAKDDRKRDERPPSGGYVNEGGAWSGQSTPKEAPAPNSDASNTSPTKSSKAAVTPLTTDDESLMDVGSDASSKRSSRSSFGQSAPSLSDSVPSGSDEQMETTTVQQSLSTIHNGSTCSSPAPPPPERHDSLQSKICEERELRGAPWFQAGIPREIVLEVLAQEAIGSFMVRESSSKPGCYALSLRVPQEFQPSGIAHYLIMQTNRGYKIKGFTKEFGTLTSLITHHSVMPELLPCPLLLSRYNPTFRKHGSSEDMVDIDEDPDYDLLSDFRKMMADLNV